MGAAETSGFGSDVSRETAERFVLLEDLVKKWNPTINLVSRESIAHIRNRHIRDSIQLFRISAFDEGVWCDLGSGGGFPGLVIAILAQELDGPHQVKLVESDARKAVFLREAVRHLGVGATVINARIEETPSVSASTLSARALASLSRLCEFAIRHLSPDGVALFPKGASFQAEVLEARRDWSFDLKVHASETDYAAAILELRNIRHA